jgi:hypothetical protein
MNPQPLFCLNLDCSSRGKIDAGNIGPHSTLEGRFRCHTCGTTFVSTKGTIFYRLRTDPKIVVLVLALLAYGCPGYPQGEAIVFAFELDARTVDTPTSGYPAEAGWGALPAGASGSGGEPAARSGASPHPEGTRHPRPTRSAPSSRTGSSGWRWRSRCGPACGWAGS